MTTANREAKMNNDDERKSDDNGKKVDIKIKLNNEWYWIELKHILVSYQKDHSFPPKLLFLQRHIYP